VPAEPQSEAGVQQLKRNGVALCFDQAGRGDPPLLLVHGWCCDHTYFAPQFGHYQRDRRVVAVDLRGHGESDKPRQPYTIAGFADDLAWLSDALGLTKPVVIGHSMGGIIAFDLAARYPERIAAIVMLDGAVVLPRGALHAIPGLLDALRGPAYREALRQYVAKVLFIPTDSPAREARILDGMAAAPQHVMVSAMEGLRDYTAPALPNDPPLPALYIAADEPSPRTDLDRLRALCPQLMYGQTVGSGHFLQLEVPEQVNAMIDRFLALTLRRSG
jgi:pimeloyl-ACP methyl ester carboxylesterase